MGGVGRREGVCGEGGVLGVGVGYAAEEGAFE